MSVPKPKQVFDDPDAHWTFVTVAEDTGFEGQCFDRKEAGRPRANARDQPLKAALKRGAGHAT